MRYGKIIAFFVLLGGGLGIYHQASPSLQNTTPLSGGLPQQTVVKRVPPEGWKEYRNDKYGFSLFYPTGYDVKEYDEGGGAATITFEDVDAMTGFQIFTVLYEEKQVTEQRFKRDIPSGVRTNLTTITVDGAVGAAFDSEHAVLGETREVWFIHTLRLYEITTLKSLEEQLLPVIKSWKFL